MAENHDFPYAKNQCYPGSLVTRKSIHIHTLLKLCRSMEAAPLHNSHAAQGSRCQEGAPRERLSPSGYPWVVITNACSYFSPWPPKSCCHLPAPPRSFMLGWESTADLSSLRSYHLTHRPGSHTTRIMASLLRAPIDLQMHALL